jgi:DNA polymerase elongation subunit (family B)
MIYEESVFDSKEDINVEDFDEVFCVKNELGILQLLINLIIRVDVDLLIAYDQEKRGIYYLLMRSIQYGIDLCDVLSRSGSL